MNILEIGPSVSGKIIFTIASSRDFMSYRADLEEGQRIIERIQECIRIAQKAPPPDIQIDQ